MMGVLAAAGDAFDWSVVELYDPIDEENQRAIAIISDMFIIIRPSIKAANTKLMRSVSYTHLTLPTNREV